MAKSIGELAQKTHEGETGENFNDLEDELRKYHSKMVVDPTSGEETNVIEFMSKERQKFTELINSKFYTAVDDSFKALKPGERNEEGYQAVIYQQLVSRAKEVYIKMNNIKDPDKFPDLERKAKEWMVGVVYRQDQRIDSFQKLIEAIISGEGGQEGVSDPMRSPYLATVLKAYASGMFETSIDEEYDGGKDKDGKSVKRKYNLDRYGQVRSSLTSNPYFRTPLLEKYGGIFKEHGYDAKFDPTADSSDIVNVVENLLDGRDLTFKERHVTYKTKRRQPGKY